MQSVSYSPALPPIRDPYPQNDFSHIFENPEPVKTVHLSNPTAPVTPQTTPQNQDHKAIPVIPFIKLFSILPHPIINRFVKSSPTSQLANTNQAKYTRSTVAPLSQITNNSSSLRPTKEYPTNNQTHPNPTDNQEILYRQFYLATQYLGRRSH